MKSMTEATNDFVDTADWLTDADTAAIAALRHAAEALDVKFNGAVLAQWYRIYADLRNRKVEGTPGVRTEQEAFLEGIGL